MIIAIHKSYIDTEQSYGNKWHKIKSEANDDN